MIFQIIWSESAVKKLKKLDKTVAKRIFKKVSELSENPYHSDVTKIIGDPYFRLRIGDYRVIFDIQNDMLRMLILNVGHLKNVYKK